MSAPTAREALAKAHYDGTEWSGCDGSRWERVPFSLRRKHYNAADAILASPALDAVVVERVAALAEDEGFRRLVRQACNDPGSFVARITRSTRGPESLPEWQDRALAAALTERGPSDG